MVNDMLKVCPACGFSFRAIDPRSGKILKTCPQCGFNIVEPRIFPPNSQDFDKKII